MQQEIIKLLEQEGKPMAPDALFGKLEDKEAAVRALDQLLSEGALLFTRKGKLVLPAQTDLAFGRIQGHPRGFGFFIPDTGAKDAFVPSDAMHGAMHQDKVWVRLMEHVSHNGSPEAEVAFIARRANCQLVGTFERDRRLGGFVVPDETRIPMDVLIHEPDVNDASPGDKVVVEIIDYPDGRRPMTGAVKEVLGSKYKAGVDILSIVRQYGLPAEFKKSAARQARSYKNPDTDAIARREDLRRLPIVTIDGADAKDLDDAISLQPLANGNALLSVHIADVSAYVAEGSAIDQEAYARGTSVYLIDHVIPMLPPELCDGVCSLTSGTDKLTLSLFMEVDKQGNVVRHRFSESVINTRHRLVYEDVTNLLQGNGKLREKYKDVVPMLEAMQALEEILRNKRVQRGSIDFDLTEADISLDAAGKAVSVDPAQRGVSNRIIEEFMILANETVARHLEQSGLPCLYRVHEPPDEDKLRELNTFLQTLGYGLKNVRKIHPKAVQKVLMDAKGTEEENVVSRVTLRSLMRARYSESNLGHFGLASKCYCHFTSPIRRYPDLVVHRILKAHLAGELDPKRVQKIIASLPETARLTSERERVAAEAERAVDDLKKCEYMQSQIGSQFHGIISGMINQGFFVELPNTVEGMVRLSSLEDDFYVFDAKNYRMTGRNTGRTLRLGDRVQILVAGVNLDARTVEFELNRDNGPKAKPKEQSAPTQGKAREKAPGKAPGKVPGKAPGKAPERTREKTPEKTPEKKRRSTRSRAARKRNAAANPPQGFRA